MKPIRLEISAFGPFVGSQTVDFQKLGTHGLFLIHGPTGSGKSSILDALCFALYGDTSGGEREGSDFVSTLDPAAVTKVVLDFEHRGVRYRATRYPTQMRAKRRGEGLTEQKAEASLEDLDAGRVIADKPSEVQRQVEAMLHCKVDQFRQTVVLPQGEFRQVVTDHKARRETLARIFDTERFAKVAERLKEMAGAMRQQGQAIQAERQRILQEAGAANVAELDQRLDDAEAALAQAEQSRQAAAEAVRQALQAKTAGEALAQDFGELDRWTAAEAELLQEAEAMTTLAAELEQARRAAQLRGDRDHADQRQREQQERLAAQAEAKALADAAAARLQQASSGKKALEAERPLLDEANTLLQRLLALKSRVDGLAEKLARRAAAQKALAAAQETLAAAKQEGAGIEEQRARLEAERQDLGPRLEAELEVKEALRLAQQASETAGQLQALRQQVAGVEAEIQAASLGHDRAGHDPLDLLSQAASAHAPGLLAPALEEGQPCPVCGSVHHPSPAAHADIGALRQAFERYGEASALLAGLRERRSGLLLQLRETRSRQGWGEVEPSSAELQQRLAQAKAGEDGLRQAKERAARIAEELVGLQAKATAATARSEEQAKRATALEVAIGSVQGEIDGALEGLDPAHRDPAAFGAALAEAQARVDQLQARFVQAEQAWQAAVAEELRARTGLEHADAALQRAVAASAEAQRAFQARLAQAGFADRAAFEAVLWDDQAFEAGEARLQAHRDRRKEVASRLEDLGRKLADRARPDLAALGEALASAEAQQVATEAVWTEATQGAQRLRRPRERFGQLEEEHAALEERRSATERLSQLANGGLSGRAKMGFETFVLQSILVQVLEVGNRHLRHMTSGRYSLLLREDDAASATGLELDVRDNASGGDLRPVRTLSGGEGFMASLALALGLSEIAQRQSGGIELGALFVDEGFGSLDAESLDQAIDILRGLRDEHRMVGIISHVEALKERVPSQLRVLRAERGSRLEMEINR